MSLKRISYIVARLDSWGRWLHSSGGNSQSWLATMVDIMNGQRVWSNTGPVRCYVPVDSIECAITDKAVMALPDDLRKAVVAWHGCIYQDGTLDTVSRELGIARGTLHRRLCQADIRVVEWLDEDRKRKQVNAVTF